MPKVNTLTNLEKQAIIDKSPLTLPNNPTQSGFSAGQIKQKLSGMVTDSEDSVLAILDEKLEEIDDAFTDTDGDVTAINGRLTTVEGKVSTLEGQNLNTRLTTAESDINQLESDVLGLDNTKTDLTYTNAQLALKANIASPTFTGTVSGITASMVGLGNVTNESKATMFTSPAFTVTPTAPTATAGTNTTQLATTAFITSQKGAANGVADLDAQGKIKVAQLPNSVFDSLHFYDVITGNTTLAALAEDVFESFNSSSSRSRIGVYFVANAARTITPSLSAVLIDGEYWIGSFKPSEESEDEAETPIVMETGDWIVLTAISGAGTVGSPWNTQWAVVNNTYENATTAIDGIVRLSNSTSTATTGNNVVTNGVINSLVGDTSTKLGRGDYAKAGYDHSLVTGNPHALTKSDISLGNVDNTTDLNKPISTATQTALDLILPYGNIEKRKDTDVIISPYSNGGTDFFVTDPISNGLKQMIINQNIKIQLWMYKMALRKGSLKGPTDEYGNPIGRRTIRKFTHAEDLTGTPSLLTGHTRPANLGDGVKMLSLQADNPSGGNFFRGASLSNINATDVTFVTNNAAHYNGYVKTEVVVTAAMIQSDNRIKIPMYDIASSWLINNTFIGIANAQGWPYFVYCKKETQSIYSKLDQKVWFQASNLPTVASNRQAFFGVRGVGMGGMNAQQVGPYAQGGGFFQGQYTPTKTLNINLAGTIPGITPFVTSRALQFRLVASTNGSSLIYGPPTNARGMFRCFENGDASSGMALKLNFVNDTRKNLVSSYFMGQLVNSL